VVHRNFLNVGDIIKIETGMNIPVDGVVITGNGIFTDESAMTTQTDKMQKETVDKCIQRR
jgi:magnesium-transporting ATPase (P-type)